MKDVVVGFAGEKRFYRRSIIKKKRHRIGFRIYRRKDYKIAKIRGVVVSLDQVLLVKKLQKKFEILNLKESNSSIRAAHATFIIIDINAPFFEGSTFIELFERLRIIFELIRRGDADKRIKSLEKSPFVSLEIQRVNRLLCAFFSKEKMNTWKESEYLKCYINVETNAGDNNVNKNNITLDCCTRFAIDDTAKGDGRYVTLVVDVASRCIPIKPVITDGRIGFEALSDLVVRLKEYVKEVSPSTTVFRLEICIDTSGQNALIDPFCKRMGITVKFAKKLGENAICESLNNLFWFTAQNVTIYGIIFTKLSDYTADIQEQIVHEVVRNLNVRHTLKYYCDGKPLSNAKLHAILSMFSYSDNDFVCSRVPYIDDKGKRKYKQSLQETKIRGVNGNRVSAFDVSYKQAKLSQKFDFNFKVAKNVFELASVRKSDLPTLEEIEAEQNAINAQSRIIDNLFEAKDLNEVLQRISSILEWEIPSELKLTLLSIAIQIDNRRMAIENSVKWEENSAKWEENSVKWEESFVKLDKIILKLEENSLEGVKKLQDEVTELKVGLSGVKEWMIHLDEVKRILKDVTEIEQRLNDQDRPIKILDKKYRKRRVSNRPYFRILTTTSTVCLEDLSIIIACINRNGRRRFTVCREVIALIIFMLTGLPISQLKYFTLFQLQRFFNHERIYIKKCGTEQFITIPISLEAEHLISLARPFWKEILEIVKQKNLVNEGTFAPYLIEESEIWSSTTDSIARQMNGSLEIACNILNKKVTVKSFIKSFTFIISQTQGMGIAEKLLNPTCIESKQHYLESEMHQDPLEQYWKNYFSVVNYRAVEGQSSKGKKLTEII